ncbi:MAG: hypothetical protein J6I95_05020, partial [Anaerotignum sp.]|nr:hypothetical protein [Anaerotignum sp.]
MRFWARSYYVTIKASSGFPEEGFERELKAKDKIIVAILVILAVVVFVGGRIHDTRTGFETEKWVNYEGNSR